MRRLFVFAICAALCVGAPGRAQTVAQSPWAARPTPGQMGQAYPALAEAMGIPGRATLECAAAVSGVLSDCVVAAETPQGLGFGTAALSLSPLFRLRPAPGRTSPVRIPLRFGGPAEAPMPATAHPPDAAVSLALRYLEASGFDRSLARASDKSIDKLIRASAALDETVLGEAARALRAATLAQAPRMLQVWARALAARVAQDDLSRAAEAFEAERGDTWRFIQPDLEAAFELTAFTHWSQVSNDVRTALCEARPCVLSPMPEDVTPLQSPSAEQIRAARPQLAAALMLTGAARLDCLVREGRLQRCRVLEEAPEGLGYGAAALSLAGDYRTPEGLAAARLLVNFPGDAVLFDPAKSRASTRTLTLARELMGARKEAEAVRISTDQVLRILESLHQDGVDPQVQGVIADAIRRASAARAPHSVDLVAGHLANMFALDQSELVGLTAFAKSPSGLRVSEAQHALLLAGGPADMAEVMAAIADQARASFCSVRSCGSEGVQTLRGIRMY